MFIHGGGGAHSLETYSQLMVAGGVEQCQTESMDRHGERIYFSDIAICMFPTPL